jgi:hypothetical protein
VPAWRRTSWPGSTPKALLDKAVAGMDEALLKAVEANRVALGQLVAQGADLREKHLKKALDDLEKFEDTTDRRVRKAAEGAGAAGRRNGARCSRRCRPAARCRAPGVDHRRAMHGRRRCRPRCAVRAPPACAPRRRMAESYTAMVSGVLLGMSDALQQGGGAGK